MNSLSTRILSAASFLLILFLGTTGFILQKAYEQSARVAVTAQLETEIHDLLRISDPVNSATLSIPGGDIDRRLMQPRSGLYAEVNSSDDRIIWQSPSVSGKHIPFDHTIAAGETVIDEVTLQDGLQLFRMSKGVLWEDEQGIERSYVFSVAQDKSLFYKQLTAFRKALWLWLLGIIVVMLVVQWFILNWGLHPLRRVTRELQRIEEGESESIKGRYPYELSGLTQALNTLIRHERNRQQRYRHAMADLAHSIKTPLAVLQSLADGKESAQESRRIFLEQVARIDDITRYQLNRAQTSGQRTFVKPVKIRPIINKICNALNKVYRDRDVNFTINCAENTLFYGDENDLMESLGNILDNACKYGEGDIFVSAKMLGKKNERVLIIEVENNGQNINEDFINNLTKRGIRADSKQEGQGLGLALVNDIVLAYAGELVLTNRVEGGVKVTMVFSQS